VQLGLKSGLLHIETVEWNLEFITSTVVNSRCWIGSWPMAMAGTTKGTLKRADATATAVESWQGTRQH
jgi:hypothetical protein